MSGDSPVSCHLLYAASRIVQEFCGNIGLDERFRYLFFCRNRWVPEIYIGRFGRNEFWEFLIAYGAHMQLLAGMEQQCSVMRLNCVAIRLGKPEIITSFSPRVDGCPMTFRTVLIPVGYNW
jgi:hypothetical protein